MKKSERDQKRSQRVISRRGLVLGGMQLGVLGALGWRMRQLQVEQADEFRFLAEENRINMRLIPPARGLIYDRNGLLIAANTPNYRVVIVREDAGDVEAVLKTLTDIVHRRLMIGLDADQGRPMYERIAAAAARELGWDDAGRDAQLAALRQYSDSLRVVAR